MVTVAVLSESIAAQIRENPDEMQNIHIIWSGNDLAALKRASSVHPQVVIIDLEHLGGNPEAELDVLHRQLGCQLSIVTFSFARREIIHRLSNDRTRVLRVPIHLRSLRLSMLSLLIKDVFHKSEPGAASDAALAPVSAPAPAPAHTHAHAHAHAASSEAERSGSSDAQRPISSDVVPARDVGEMVPADTPVRYTVSQLGRLQEVVSALKCECPNHLAGILTSLSAFEEYSKNCKNLNREDAAIHAYLFRETSRARYLMQEALRVLCSYEKISI